MYIRVVGGWVGEGSVWEIVCILVVYSRTVRCKVAIRVRPRSRIPPTDPARAPRAGPACDTCICGDSTGM